MQIKLTEVYCCTAGGLYLILNSAILTNESPLSSQRGNEDS